MRRRSTDGPTYFVDRCLGSSIIPSALRAANALVEVHEEHFAHDARDEDWLAVVGSREWIVLTKDDAIRRRPNEQRAIRDAAVGAFVVTAGGLAGHDLARILVQALPAMARFVDKHRRPFIVTISRSCDLRIVLGGERRGGARKE